MRLALHLLGRELLAVTLDRPPATEPWSQGEHDNVCAQVERAEPARIGFRVPVNPSVEE